MMRKFLVKVTGLFLLLLSQTVFANTGLLFNVVATGASAKVSINLCLNGKGAVSCQNYTVTGLNLNLSTTIPNHLYPNAGIKINTPGYTITNLGLDCKMYTNGYCLFPVSNTTPKNIVIENMKRVTIGGSISGLVTNGLVLTNNGTDDLPVSNGSASFQFGMTVPVGGTYNVIVDQQPMGLTCSVVNGAGSNVSANVTNINVICSATTYTIGGSISGLTANGLVLRNNGADNLLVTNGATSFQFPTPVASGGSYHVTVFQQPTGLICSVVNGTGMNINANVTNVSVTCRGYIAYVANEGSGNITPIIIATNTPDTSIPVGNGPFGVAMTPNGITAYVGNYFDNTVTPITIATNTPGTPIPVGNSPLAIAITPDGTRAYVTNENGNDVTPIDIATNTPGTPIPVGLNPSGIAITPDGTTAYVVNRGDDTVTPITITTNTPGTPISVGSSPNYIAITPDGTTAYVTNGNNDNVTPIDIATNTPGTPIPVGMGPIGIAITPDGATAYVANSVSDNVTPITIATNTPGIPIPVGTTPSLIAITPDGVTAYVTNTNSTNVTPITIATNIPGALIPVGVIPFGIAIS